MAKQKAPTETTTKGPPTKKILCSCDHEIQDKMYGNKVRLHNKTAKGYRCVVCLKMKN